MRNRSELANLNVSLPRSQRDFVESEAARLGCTTTSEYVRRLITEAQHRAAEPPRSLSGEPFDREKAREAIQTILALQQRLSLNGLSIEDLINEGRAL